MVASEPPAREVKVEAYDKTYDQLSKELTVARQRIAELEAEEAELKSAARVLRESEQRFRAQYKGLSTPVYSWQKVGDDFVLFDYNDAAERITHGSVVHLLGAKASELYRNEPDILAEIWRCYAEKRDFRREMLYRYRIIHERRYLSVCYAFVPPDIVLVHTEDITERREAESALQREQDFTSAVLDTAGALVVVLDLHGRIVRFNRACEQITGYSCNEVMGRCFWELFLIPEETEPVRVVFGQLAAGQFPNEHENHWVAKDGKRHLIAWSNTALLDGAGSVEYIIGTGIDITERRRAEEALKQAYDELELRVQARTEELWQLNKALEESEERFRRAFEHAAFGMALVGTDGCFLQVNQSCCEMLGYAEPELLGKTFQEITYADDLATGLELFQDLMAGRRDFGWLEKRYIRKDGRVIWVLLSTAVVRDPVGRPAYLVSQFQDLTERKEAAVQLAEKEEQYRSIFEATGDGLIINDMEGRVVEVNPAFCKMHGYLYEELVGSRPTWFMHAEGDSLLEEYLRTVRSGKPFQGHAIDLCKDGTALHVEVNGAPFTYRGRPHILGVVRDVTERVLARQMLEQRVAARTRELAALYDVTAVASASLDLETVLERSLDRVLEVMGCDVGGIHLLDETGQLLHLAVWQGMAPDVDTEVDGLSHGGGLVGWVADHGEPLVVPDIAEQPEALPSAAQVPGAHAYLGAPVHAKGQILGVLSVVGGLGRQFSAEEVALLGSIADQVGVAVENARLYRQAERLAVLEERERLGRELHDSVTQSLYSANLMVETGRRAAEAGDLKRTKGYLRRLGEITQGALKEMRLLVYELRPPELAREGLAGALQKRLDAVEGRAGVETRLRVEGEVNVPAPVEEALYRIAQEALNNALRHAAATSVAVCIRADEGQLYLEVTDNGCGFDPPAAQDAGGMGLTSMRQRVERVGGALAIHSAAGEGTRVQVSVKLGSKEQ